MNHLPEILRQIGQPVEVLTAADGTRLIALPDGGRVLGLFASGNDTNFLWTNPALESVASARSVFVAGAWPNSGGDRTWIAPEIEFFLPDYPATSPYVVPAAIDPGAFTCELRGAQVRFINRGTLRAHRSKVDLSFVLTKDVALIGNPLPPDELLREFPTAAFAGYSTHTTLEVSGPTMPVGLWHLLQLPHGGEMIIATRGAANPRPYFGPLPAGAVTVGERAVRYRMDAAGVFKLGVKARACTGRVGYVWGTGDAATLVVRAFAVDPAGRYVDPPWDDVDDLGYAVQACNVSTPALGNFSELEYHASGIGGDSGPTRGEDASQVWAFRGPAEFIRRAADRLLGTGANEGRGS